MATVCGSGPGVVVDVVDVVDVVEVVEVVGLASVVTDAGIVVDAVLEDPVAGEVGCWGTLPCSAVSLVVCTRATPNANPATPTATSP
jgi:hypothetical protein